MDIIYASYRYYYIIKKKKENRIFWKILLSKFTGFKYFNNIDNKIGHIQNNNPRKIKIFNKSYNYNYIF